MSGQPFIVMAKPVGSRCNMRCNYCYYLDKGQFSSHEKQTRMTFSLLEKLIRQTIEGNDDAAVSFIWHGGEPTLAGIDFYKKAVELQKKYLPKGRQVWNSLQTNGLLINDAWARFLSENRFDVGLSIDGDELVHNVNRKDMGGKGTYDRVSAAVGRLKRVGIRPDLLCTVNSVTAKYPAAVYAALRRFDTGWVQFIPIVARKPDGGLTPESVTADEYGKFLCEIFDIWSQNDLGKSDVQLFAETARILAGGTPALCWMGETCGRALVVEEDGSVYSCDHFVDEAHRLGNVNSDRLENLANSAEQLNFGESKKTALTEQCKVCLYLKFCGGGCLKDRFAYSDAGEEGQYYLCGGLRNFFSYAVPILEKMIGLSRAGKKTNEIMFVLQG